MTEGDYIRVSNRARLAAAISILGEVIPGYGITAEEIQTLARILKDNERNLSELIGRLME